MRSELLEAGQELASEERKLTLNLCAEVKQLQTDMVEVKSALREVLTWLRNAPPSSTAVTPVTI